MMQTNGPPKHVRVTLYMPPDMLADLDQMRVELMREGTNVDRGEVIRAALRVAHTDPARWMAVLKEGEAA